MSIEYFEDIKLHQKHRSRGYLLEEEDIIDFARQWNPQPYHIDPEFARKGKIGSLFACGPHLISICAKLTNEKKDRPATITGLGMNHLQFVNPGRPGDILVLEIEATSKRSSKSDPKTGIVHYDIRLLNQREDLVLTYKVATMVEKRRGDALAKYSMGPHR